MGKLTQARLKTLTKPGRYGDGDGLWLQVRDADRRAWLFRFRAGGRAHAMGLGSLSDVGLAEARHLAGECRALLRQGKNPLDNRREERAAARRASGQRFRDVVDLYVQAHGGAWRSDKHREQWESSLRAHAYPKFGDDLVADIGTDQVMAALEPIWAKMPETASRLRGRIEAVLDFAKAREWRAGENPARWRGHLKNLLPAKAKLRRVQHHAAIPYRAIGDFMAELREQPGIAALALQFVILTAARTGEVLGARWDEIDQQHHVWIIAGDRMKAGAKHRVPLSAAAREILKELVTIASAPDSLIFPGRREGRSLSDMAMSRVLLRMNRLDTTVHGFRSAFRDWAAEQTAFSTDVVEACLAHTQRNKTEAAYRRTDFLERRVPLMEAWAEFCGTPSSTDGNVVPMHRPGSKVVTTVERIGADEQTWLAIMLRPRRGNDASVPEISTSDLARFTGGSLRRNTSLKLSDKAVLERYNRVKEKRHTDPEYARRLDAYLEQLRTTASGLNGPVLMPVRVGRQKANRESN